MFTYCGVKWLCTKYAHQMYTSCSLFLLYVLCVVLLLFIVLYLVIRNTLFLLVETVIFDHPQASLSLGFFYCKI